MKHQFECAGRRYKFRFHKEGPVVKCRMFMVDDSGNEMWIETSTATCSPSDKFNYRKGKKLALGRMLRTLNDTLSGTFTKEVRTQIWHEVLQRIDLGG